MARSTATQARIADAAWKIQERGAPSPRAYERLMAAWVRQVRTALRRLLTEDLAADAEPLEDEAARQRRLARFLSGLRSLRLPPPPTPTQIAVVNAPAARQGIRAARRSLLQVGLPREVMETRFQIPSGPEDLLLGIDIAPTAQDREILTRWSREGTDLIRSVGQDLVAGLDEHVVDLARSGRPLSDLAKVVQERLGVAERHAAFIARDQVAKLNNALTESTQRAAGVTRYRWRSANDPPRVRPMHHALDGSIHAWDDPPVTNENGDRNHPGEDYQCRCTAIPVLDENAQPRAPKPLRPGLTPTDEPQRTTPRRVQPARPSTPEVERADHLDAWVHGSRSKKAVAWKQAAIDELGAGGVPYSRRDFDFRPEDLAAARRSLRLQYEQTQAALRDRGVKEVRLYRGIKGEYTAAGAIESWTTDLETAKRFAGRNGKVLIETVPASRIVAHSGGPGWKNGRFGEQHEWMVLGAK